MPEEDTRIFNEAYQIYNKYRWSLMKTDTQWTEFSNEVRDFARAHNWARKPLAKRMAEMLLDVFCDMYKDNKTPEIPDYFGRSDL